MENHLSENGNKVKIIDRIVLRELRKTELNSCFVNKLQAASDRTFNVNQVLIFNCKIIYFDLNHLSSNCVKLPGLVK